MTRVLDKHLDDIYTERVDLDDNKIKKFIINDVRTKYQNLQKRNTFDIDYINSTFKIIIENAIATINYGSHQIFGVKMLENILKMDFEKYINCDQFRVTDVFYNPYNYIFLKNYVQKYIGEVIENTTYTKVILDNSDSVWCLYKISFPDDETYYYNIANVLLTVVYNNIKRYYSICYFLCGDDSYSNIIPRCMEIPENLYEKFIKYIEEHPDLKISKNEKCFLDDLQTAEETNENSSTQS